MLGILLGTDDGVLHVVPGEDTRRAIEGLAVAALDYRDGVALAAVEADGVWINRGQGWSRCWEGNARCVRVGPGAHALYIGVEPAAIFESHTDGMHWQELGSLRGVLRYARDVRSPPGAEHAYVAGICFGEDPEHQLLVGVAGAGAWYTPDGGSTFMKRADGLDPDLHALRQHPERNERVYASAPSGFYRSDDGGFTWVQSLGGLDRSWAGDAAVLPGAPDVLVLGVARRPPGLEGALFRSANGGVSWSRVPLDGEDEWERAPLVTRLWDTADTVFVFAGDKLWASHDSGRNWVCLAAELPPARALAVAL